MTTKRSTEKIVRDAFDVNLGELTDSNRERIGELVLDAIDGSKTGSSVRNDVGNDAGQVGQRSWFRVAGVWLAAGAAACVLVGWMLGRSTARVPLELEAVNLVETSPGLDGASVPEQLESTQQQPRVFVASASETRHLRIGEAELTIIGPARIEVDSGNVVRVHAGTVVGRSADSLLVVMDSAGTARLVGPNVGIRVERGVVVASASSETAVKREFGSLLEPRPRDDDPLPKIVDKNSHKNVHKNVHKNSHKTALAPPSSVPLIATGQDAAEDADAGAMFNVDAAPSPTEVSASLYADSESAMKSGDLAVAAKHLDDLVRLFPGSSDAQLARYDLALLDFRAGRFDGAIARLDSILTNTTSASRRRAATRLRCRVLATQSNADPSDC